MKHISHLFPLKFIHPATTQLVFIAEICKPPSSVGVRNNSYSVDRLSQNTYTSRASVSDVTSILRSRSLSTSNGSTDTDDAVNPLETVSDDFFYCTRPLFIVGKCFGLIPIKGLLGGKLDTVLFKWKSFSTFVSIFVCLSILAVALIGISELFADFFGPQPQTSKRHGRFRIVDTRGPLCLIVGSLTYSLMVFKSQRIINLFRRWRLASSGLVLTSNPKNLFKSINVLTFTLLIPGIIHMDVMQITGFGIFKVNLLKDYEKSNMSTMERFYTTYCPHWCEIVPYSPVLVTFFFITAKLAFFAWIFIDTLIIVMSKLLYSKFETLFIQTKLRISTPKKKSLDLIVFRKTSVETLWLSARKDHLICLHLLWETEKVLSPFIFLSYALSIYYICMLIHQGISPAAHQNSLVKATIAIVTLTALIARMTFVSIMASRIHEYAHSIIKCVQKCPTSLYSSELERLERFLSNNTAGLGGLGCFVVTKAFLLVVVSVIFTFEIVLLQTPYMGFSKFNSTLGHHTKFHSPRSECS